jgi:prolyl-tRNA synthetase
MSQKPKTAISPTRSEDYPEWYQEVLKAADLAEHSPVRGCMVIKPWGYQLWENIQAILDRKFKETGHQNAYFPLFIPLSFFEKEAAHIEGFAKECAIVTHHRLEKGKDGKLVPAGELDEPLIVRPTSEMIIGEMFAKWISSYRELPLLINQWCNVVRWEMRTRLFLRTTEFLWQEGHTAHATEEEARDETMMMLDVYNDFAHKKLAIPVIKGEKTEGEKFPGAVNTYTIEAMMQDKKALQGGTSHFLGQNFAKAAQIKFRDKDGAEKLAWTTSWGLTTRMIGALVMTHGDDDGLVLPPKIASAHMVIIPIIHKEESRDDVIRYCKQLAGELRHVMYDGKPLTVIVDERDMRGGDKSWSWIKKGVPVRLEIGPRDIAEDKVMLFRRDKPHKESLGLGRGQLIAQIGEILDLIQDGLYDRALKFRDAHIKKIDNRDEFYRFFENDGGFAYSHFSGDPIAEETLKKDLSVTIRCIPLGWESDTGSCIMTGKKSERRVLFAKAY